MNPAAKGDDGIEETETASVFEEQRYVPLRGLIETREARELYQYACRVADAGLMESGDGQVPGTPFRYGDFFMDDLLRKLQPKIEAASGRRLFPTYSYFRVYKNGDELTKHRDRPSCEISVTLCLGYEGAESWPILITGPGGGTSAVNLNPGDALLYRGAECEHWREKFTGTRQAQVFLHYVDQDGPHAEWKFDKRDSTTDRGSLIRKNSA